MFTILGSDGKQYGPVPADKVQAWICDGRANLQTQAQRQGDTEWKTLADFPEFNPASTPALTLNQPVFNPPPVATAATTGAAHLPSPPPGQIDVFECLSQSFHLWKSNFLPLVGVTLLIVLIQGVIGLIPIIGALSGLFLNGVFYGGLYYYYLGKMRGEPRELSDAFAGFTRAFVPLMLTSLLQSCLLIGGALVFFAPWIGFFGQIALHPGTHPDLPAVSPLLIGFSVVGFVAVIYFSVCIVFSFVLVIDKGLGPWTAIVTSWRAVTGQWFRVFFVMLLGAILTMLGLIMLFVGVLLTLPLMIGAVLYAYETLFNSQVSAAPKP